MGHQAPTGSTTSVGPISASAVAVVGQGRMGYVLITPGSDATTVTIYDSANSTTTNKLKLFYGKFVANAKTEAFSYVPGVLYDSGLYVEITGTSVGVIVYTY